MSLYTNAHAAGECNCFRVVSCFDSMLFSKLCHLQNLQRTVSQVCGCCFYISNHFLSSEVLIAFTEVNALWPRTAIATAAVLNLASQEAAKYEK